MYKNKYSFCGCKFEIITQEPLDSGKDFHLFRSDFSVADYSVTVHETKGLPEPNAELTFSTLRKKIYGHNPYSVYASYYEPKIDDFYTYGCCVNNQEMYLDFPFAIRDDVVFDCLDLPPILLTKGIGILHSSYIEVDGCAVLFCGKKMIGKSTQAALWEKYANATVLNGDRAGVYCENGLFYADGIPFSGTSKICVNKKLPLKAIVALDKGQQNDLQLLSTFQAFIQILGQFAYYSRPDDFNMMADLVTSLCEKVPVYHYSCLKDESAVNVLKKELFSL